MTAASFDTLAAARSMEKAGLERSQAEAIAAAIAGNGGDLVTRAGLTAALAALETRLTWRLVAAIAAMNAVLVAAVKLIP